MNLNEALKAFPLWEPSDEAVARAAAESVEYDEIAPAHDGLVEFRLDGVAVMAFDRARIWWSPDHAPADALATKDANGWKAYLLSRGRIEGSRGRPAKIKVEVCTECWLVHPGECDR